MRISAVQKFTMLDYPEHLACIVFTAGCNFRCGYCHNPEFVLPEQIQQIKQSFIPEEAVFNFLAARQGKLEGVVVTGGEPTLHYDLHRFIERVKSMGFKVKLDTNGNNPMVLEELLRRELLDYVAMDVKTDSENYEKLVGGCVRRECIEKSISVLLESNIPFEFRSTLIREVHTPAILKNMGNMMQGAPQLYLQSFRPGHTLDPAYETYHPFTQKEMQDIAGVFRQTITHVFLR